MSKQPETEYDEDYRLLREWGVIYVGGFIWRPTPGTVMSVRTHKHSTKKAADAETCDMARQAGYEPPKWWQYWRWSERPLPLVEAAE